MKTYFIAGESLFSDGVVWKFHRLVNWTDKNTPHEFLESILTELENFSQNTRNGEKGNLVLTAFNQV